MKEQPLADLMEKESLELHWITAAMYAEDPNHSGFLLKDLDNDGLPEVIIKIYSGGAHCCSTSFIYNGLSYEGIAHYWGDGAGPKFKDLDGNGTVEMVYRDTRFAYAFTGYAASGMPLCVWNYRLGKVLDETRRYKQTIYDDAFFWWERFQASKRVNRESSYDDYGKGLLAAYVADKYLLGQGRQGWQLAQEAYEGPDKSEFFAQLKSFLQENGYSGR